MHCHTSRMHLAGLAFGILLGSCASGGDANLGKSSGFQEGTSSEAPHAGSKNTDASATAHEKADAETKTNEPADTLTMHDAATKAFADAGTIAAVSLPCEIAAIVSKNCGACHGKNPAGGAPMSLTSAADFQAPGASDATKKVYEIVKTRVNANTKPMPPVSPLSAQDLETLNDWLDKGALPSEKACVDNSTPDAGSDDGADIDVSGLECYKMLAHAEGDKQAKFPVGAAVDAYWDFGFQAPWQGTLYGVVVRPVVDNIKVLHHWLLYREPVDDGSIAATIGQHAGGELIHGWAPGGVPLDFRRHGDVGIELSPTTYSVEVHYNSNDPNALDASGVELCGTRTPPKDIATMSWVGYDQGGLISYATGICTDPSDEWVGTCAPSNSEPIHILFVVPHMHKTGTHMKAIINGPNGSRVLHDNPFDFNYQVTYETNELLMPGESITTTCTYSAPNCAGQSTSQEMCYLFTYAYPKYALVDNGPEGSFMHGQGACLGQ